MTEPMPELLSAALFQRDAAVPAVLAVHRRAGKAPFAGQWLLPLTRVNRDETAEDAVRRHAREQFGIEVPSEVFADTVYVQDPDDSHRYVANIFRAQMGADPMRFRGDGDYDDARWLTAEELGALWMPPELRTAVIRLLNEPDAPPSLAWDDGSAEGTPLAERADAPNGAPPPDNRAAWETIAATFQREHEFIDPARLRWGRGLYEEELQLLGGIGGQRALVLGSGAGQDVIALASMGAVAIGIDIAPSQVAYARRLAAKHDANNASFAEGDVTDLSRFDDASFDLAVSIHALGFVEHAGRAITEAARVLRPGGVLAICVSHPWSQMMADAAPYRADRSYWAPHLDWNWDEEAFGDAGRIRDWRRTVQQWCAMMTDVGFGIERLLEPYQGDIPATEAEGFDMARARLMPSVLIIKARKR